jgi:putative oxidoreductase
MGLAGGKYAGYGIALIRVVMGLMLIYSGYLKVIALNGVTGFFRQMAIPAPEILAPVITAGEIIGGVLLVLGLGIRYVPWWFIAMFIVTTFYVKLPREAPIFGYDAARIDILLLCANIMLLLEGAGAFALDTSRAKRAEVQAQTAQA